MSMATVEPSTGVQVFPSVEVSVEKKVWFSVVSCHRTISTYAGEVTLGSASLPDRFGTPSYVRHWMVADPPGFSVRNSRAR